MIWLGLNIFLKFADENFVVCLLVVTELSIIFVTPSASRFITSINSGKGLFCESEQTGEALYSAKFLVECTAHTWTEASE